MAFHSTDFTQTLTYLLVFVIQFDENTVNLFKSFNKQLVFYGTWNVYLNSVGSPNCRSVNT